MGKSSKIYNSSLVDYSSEMGNFISSSGIHSRTMVVLYKREAFISTNISVKTVKQETQDVFTGYNGLHQPIPLMGL